MVLPVKLYSHIAKVRYNDLHRQEHIPGIVRFSLSCGQYGLGAQILAALGLHRITLVTNSPTPRVVGLDAYGLAIAGTRPIPKE